MKLKSLKIFILAAVAALLACVGALGGATMASAAPTATAKVDLHPQKYLFQQVVSPVKATFEAHIVPAPGALTLNPLIEANTIVPRGTKFVPNKKMPVCRYFNKVTANVDTTTALNKSGCKKSLIGNGTANLFIAQSTNPAALDISPRVLIFNGGRDNRGNGKIVIQAYSYKTKVGITFGGKIANGVLDIHIPRLTYDSSIPVYSLSIPGTPIPPLNTAEYSIPRVPAGKDPKFVRAKCPTGKWKSSATYHLGKRSETGQVSDRSTVKSASYTENCNGWRGKPKFKRLKIRGPRHVRRGHKATYRVTVKNRGTRTAKHVRIKAFRGGRGYRKDGNVFPHSHKTIKVKVRIKGHRGHWTKVKFKAAAKGAKSFGKFRVKVK